MSIKKTTTIKCDWCKKEQGFYGDRPRNETGAFPAPDGNLYLGSSLELLPLQWYVIKPDLENSIWYTGNNPASGNFCSLECMRDYINDLIERRKGDDSLTIKAFRIENDDTQT